jgi:predicted TIM-barrel fold metal-dependent hydrolase
VIDAQLHARDEREIAAHVASMSAAGVDGAVLVQTVGQGYDNSFLLDAAAAHRGMFAVVGVLDPSSREIESEVAAFRETSFTLGLRIVALSDERRDRLRSGGYERLAAAAERGGLPLFVYAPRELDLVQGLAERHPELLVVLDHIGLPQPPVLAAGENPWSAFPRVLRLGRLANVALKWTALPTLSLAAYPFPDLWPRLHELVAAYGPERLMWGTDITREAIGHTYEQAVDYLRETVELGPEEKAQLLGGTLRTLCGWDRALAQAAPA